MVYTHYRTERRLTAGKDLPLPAIIRPPRPAASMETPAGARASWGTYFCRASRDVHRSSCLRCDRPPSPSRPPGRRLSSRATSETASLVGSRRRRRRRRHGRRARVTGRRSGVGGRSPGSTVVVVLELTARRRKRPLSSASIRVESLVRQRQRQRLCARVCAPGLSMGLTRSRHRDVIGDPRAGLALARPTGSAR